MLQYWTAIVTEATIFSIMALGVDMIWGWSGDFDLSAYTYFALGVYMTMVLTIGPAHSPVEYILGLRLPYLVAVGISTVCVVGFAAIVGTIALRSLRNIYFSITTFGAAWAIYYVVENYTPLFNGYNGLSGLNDPMGGSLSYNAYHYFFLGFCAAVLIGVYLVVQRLSRSPYGRMVRAVRDDEHAAAVYGRNVFSVKLRNYLFGAALTGLAGGLFAAYIGAFNALDWKPTEIFVLYAAILVGGRGNPRGVILGNFIVYIGFVEFTRYIPSPAARPELGSGLRQILIGVLIVAMLRFRPSGILPERLGTDGTEPARSWRERMTGRAGAAPRSEDEGEVANEPAAGDGVQV
jgi:branched-chain amino acid transport system permease protein